MAQKAWNFLFTLRRVLIFISSGVITIPILDYFKPSLEAFAKLLVDKGPTFAAVGFFPVLIFISWYLSAILVSRFVIPKWLNAHIFSAFFLKTKSSVEVSKGLADILDSMSDKAWLQISEILRLDEASKEHELRKLINKVAEQMGVESPYRRHNYL